MYKYMLLKVNGSVAHFSNYDFFFRFFLFTAAQQ